MEAKETACHPEPLENATCIRVNGGCYGNGRCHYIGNCRYKVKTNGDHFRKMTNREMAEFLAKKFTNAVVNCMAQEGTTMTATQIHQISHTMFCYWLQWLERPHEEGMG